MAIVRGPVEHGYAGVAHIGEGGLERVALARGADDGVLVHELAHAFVATAAPAPAALDEGRATLLSRCVLAGLDRPDAAARLDRFGAAAPLVDLHAWTNPPGADPVARWQAYGAAYALFDALADLVPLPVLLDPALDDWAGLVALVDAAPPERRDRVLARIGRSSPWSDLDGDGYPIDVELGFGLDPGRADGPDAPRDPVLVPGAPFRCAGVGAGGAPLRLKPAPDVVWAVVDDGGRGSRVAPDGWLVLPPRAALLVKSARSEGPAAPLRLESRPDGPLPRDPGCRGPRVVWPDGAPDEVAALSAALLRAADHVEPLLPEATWPLVVVVDDGATFADPTLRSPPQAAPLAVGCVGCEPGPRHAVHLGADLRPLADAGAWDTLAAVAVALHAAWTAPLDHPDLGLVEALAQDLVVGPVAATDLAPYDLGAWRVAARRCGWDAVLAGACEPPDDAPEPGPVPR